MLISRLRVLTLAAGAVLSLGSCGGGGDDDEGGTGTVAVASVSLSPANDTTLTVGATRTVSAIPRSSGGTALSGRAITWTTSAPSIVSLSSGTGGAQTLTAVAPGSSTITATSEGKSSHVTITVVAAGPAVFTSTVVSPATKTITVGMTTTLFAEGRDQNGTAMSGLPAPTWSSSNNSVATVNSSGVVTAVATGTATITGTITSGGTPHSGTSTITVTTATVVSSATVTTNATAWIYGSQTSALDPIVIDLSAGGSVTFTNSGSGSHDLLFAPGNPAAIANQPTASTTWSVTRTFTTPGTYKFRCDVHSGDFDSGMVGRVIVH